MSPPRTRLAMQAALEDKVLRRILQEALATDQPLSEVLESVRPHARRLGFEDVLVGILDWPELQSEIIRKVLVTGMDREMPLIFPEASGDGEPATTIHVTDSKISIQIAGQLDDTSRHKIAGASTKRDVGGPSASEESEAQQMETAH